MHFVDLRKQYERLENEIRSRLDAVLGHQQFIMGPEVEELEQRLTAYTGRRRVFTCSNGTDALMMVLMACGIGAGDAVFVPAFTFFATAECVSLAGGTPVFVDVEPDTFNISPQSLEESIEATIQNGKLKPCGVIAVDLFGLPADYARIIPIAEKYGLFVVEDGAQGFGGSCGDQSACGFGGASTTSFFPAKPLGCYGDGGAVFTDDEPLADKLESIRVHGKGTNKYDNIRIGLNARLDTMQAAVLLAKLTVFDDELAARNRVASAYTERLSNIIRTPHVPEGFRSAWAQYTVTAESEEQRARILEGLAAQNIPAMVYYTKPLHLSTAYSHLEYQEGSLPVCEDLSRRVFSLPMHPYLTVDEIERICSAVLSLSG